MKRKKDYTIEAILFCLLLAVLGSFVGSCNAKQVNVRDYQLETYNDSIVIYDGNRKVGTAAWSEKDHSEIECIILEDNL